VAWPDPARPIPLGELVWSQAGAASDEGPVAAALAYDVETSQYLRRVEPPSGFAPGTPMLDASGRVTGDPPHSGGPAVIFMLRRVSGGRIRGVRAIALPAPAGGTGHLFRLQRLDVSLTHGRRALAWFVRPLLVFTSLSLPLGVLALLLAPWLRRGSRREATAFIAPHLEAMAAFAAGAAVAAPAVVAIASLWGSR
jgi:hypothetical protein